ncbi:MAG: ABC transporter permease, partial [Erysipelotrichaceae bacterium]|nr:ABC transporter permease [Erysipelotrichaceae bacterium]
MPQVFLKNIIAEIRSNFGRFLSIMAIVALGVAFFAGIKASAPDMKHSADTYFDQYRLQDVQVFSTLGLYDKDVEEIRQLSGVEDAQAIFTLDTLTNLKTTQLVVKVISYDQNTNVNLVRLIEGRMPENDNECLIEAASATSNMFGAFSIGNTISL